jgi:uracil phosphoribosyltransferase
MLILDPMIATGGSMNAALKIVINSGIKEEDITVV